MNKPHLSINLRQSFRVVLSRMKIVMDKKFQTPRIIMATLSVLLIISCSSELDEAKRLGFANVAEMKEAQAKGFYNKERYQEAQKAEQKAAEEKQAVLIANTANLDTAESVSRCAATHLSVIAMLEADGQIDSANQMSKYTGPWADLALATGQRAGLSEEQVKERNRANFKYIKDNMESFIKESRKKLQECSDFIKGSEDLKQFFIAAANGQRANLNSGSSSSSAQLSSGQGVDLTLNSLRQVTEGRCVLAVDMKNNTNHNITSLHFSAIAREEDNSVMGSGLGGGVRIKPQSTAVSEAHISAKCSDIRFVTFEVKDAMSIDGRAMMDGPMVEEIMNGKSFSSVAQVKAR